MKIKRRLPVRMSFIQFGENKEIHLAEFRDGGYGIRLVVPISASDLRGLKSTDIRAKKVNTGSSFRRVGNKKFQEIFLSLEAIKALGEVLRDFPNGLKTWEEWEKLKLVERSK